MDPNACFRALLESEHRCDSYDLACDLLAWRARGGFLPEFTPPVPGRPYGPTAVGLPGLKCDAAAFELNTRLGACLGALEAIEWGCDPDIAGQVFDANLRHAVSLLGSHGGGRPDDDRE